MCRINHQTIIIGKKIREVNHWKQTCLHLRWLSTLIDQSRYEVKTSQPDHCCRNCITTAWCKAPLDLWQYDHCHRESDPSQLMPIMSGVYLLFGQVPREGCSFYALNPCLFRCCITTHPMNLLCIKELLLTLISDGYYSGILCSKKQLVRLIALEAELNRVSAGNVRTSLNAVLGLLMDASWQIAVH